MICDNSSRNNVSKLVHLHPKKFYFLIFVLHSVFCLPFASLLYVCLTLSPLNQISK